MSSIETPSREAAARNWPFASIGGDVAATAYRSPSPPPNERQRLDALTRTEILESLPEQAYDDLVTLATQICGAPMGLIGMIDRDRQWFKAKVGFPSSETPRDLAFCAHAILVPDEVFAIHDAQRDSRFATHPFVTGAPHIRFYAGASIVNDDGHALGTLCVIDHKTRSLDDTQKHCLQILARQASALLKTRKERVDASKRVRRQQILADETLLRQEHGDELLGLVLSGSDLGMWNLHVPSGEWTINLREQSMLGLSSTSIASERLDWKERIHPDDWPVVQAAMQRHASGESPYYECVHRMRHRDGHWLPITCRAVIVERDADGRAVRIVGTHRELSPTMGH